MELAQTYYQRMEQSEGVARTDAAPGCASCAQLRAFAGQVCRLQLDLLRTLAREDDRRASDLPGWSLEMYAGIRDAVVLHTAALAALVPDDDDVHIRSDSASWVEDIAVELGRVLDGLERADEATPGSGGSS
jgi:hypothetical protein